MHAIVCKRQRFLRKPSAIQFALTPTRKNKLTQLSHLNWLSSQRSFNQTLRSAHTWSDVSPRDFASLEDTLCKNVGSTVIDPILQKDLSSLKWIDRRLNVAYDGAAVKVTLKLPTLLHPSMLELKALVEKESLKELEKWISSHKYELDSRVDVEITTTKPIPAMARYVENHEELLKQVGPGLVNVSQYLAVYSCKGGVGKSTIAVNLAYELAKMGGRIGLLDVDIYGPSLPILVKPSNPAVLPSPLGKGMVYPISHMGVKLLSLGYVSPKSGVPGSGSNAGAAVMRGPMAGRVVSQLLKATDWGELDVLILDLPPGTGDVQLAVGQELQLSGAIAVTTPSKLATEDTRKGIAMFTSLGIPTLAVVENMSYFICEGGSKHYPFGSGMASSAPANAVKHSNIIRLPISTMTNDSNDAGVPLCVSRPENGAEEELASFEQLARITSKELLLLRYADPESEGMINIGGVRFEIVSLNCSIEAGKDAFSVRLYCESGARKISVPASNIRSRDPKTGEQLSNSSGKSANSGEARKDDMVIVHKASHNRRHPSNIPTSIEKKGRYGFAVEWEDGATIIYSMQTIAKAAAETVEQLS